MVSPSRLSLVAPTRVPITLSFPRLSPEGLNRHVVPHHNYSLKARIRNIRLRIAIVHQCGAPFPACPHRGHPASSLNAHVQ
jgi:hypothetical protein